MRECVGVILFIIFLVLWSKVSAHHGIDPHKESLHAQVMIETNLQYPRASKEIVAGTARQAQ